MENLATAISLMTPGCFMASLDYKDAYYSIAIAPEHQKFFKFIWRGQLYKFLAMPQGLNCAPQKFTKCLKPVYASLRKMGHVSIGYIDDSFLTGRDVGECRANVLTTANLFNRLGFVIHPTKSVFAPSQELQFLGFVLDSRSMTVSLPIDKAKVIKSACLQLLEANQCNRLTIRHVSVVIGLMVASFPGVELGPLYYRSIESDKIRALKIAKGNFDGAIRLSTDALRDIRWWVNHVESNHKAISHGMPSLTIECDASTRGWGCCIQAHDRAGGGEWSPEEAGMHINCLELTAALLALKSLCRRQGCHVRLMIDNMTAVAYIREMGGSHSHQCNAIAREIWNWAIENNNWLSVCHLPGVLNVVADRESRRFHTDTEWMLDKDILHKALRFLGADPVIDLFASRSNYQLKPYISWRPDPEAVHIDAFSYCWSKGLFYAFPPFSLIPQVLQKIREDRASGILVVPDWPTQPWYPSLLRLITCHPYKVKRSRHLLSLPTRPHEVHPLHRKMDLLICRLSGMPCNPLPYLTPQQP